MVDTHIVIPAQAGIHSSFLAHRSKEWIPACAGMTLVEQAAAEFAK